MSMGKKLDKWMCLSEERNFLVFHVGDNLQEGCCASRRSEPFSFGSCGEDCGTYSVVFKRTGLPALTGILNLLCFCFGVCYFKPKSPQCWSQGTATHFRVLLKIKRDSRCLLVTQWLECDVCAALSMAALPSLQLKSPQQLPWLLPLSAQGKSVVLARA